MFCQPSVGVLLLWAGMCGRQNRHSTSETSNATLKYKIINLR